MLRVAGQVGLGEQDRRRDRTAHGHGEEPREAAGIEVAVQRRGDQRQVHVGREDLRAATFAPARDHAAARQHRTYRAAGERGDEVARGGRATAPREPAGERGAPRALAGVDDRAAAVSGQHARPDEPAVAERVEIEAAAPRASRGARVDVRTTESSWKWDRRTRPSRIGARRHGGDARLPRRRRDSARDRGEQERKVCDEICTGVSEAKIPPGVGRGSVGGHTPARPAARAPCRRRPSRGCPRPRGRRSPWRGRRRRGRRRPAPRARGGPLRGR